MRGYAMKMHVYGSGGQDCPTVLIIHPMLSSASSMKAALCDHMGSGLRFLAPDLSSHGEEAAAPYVSAANEAAAIHSWLAEHDATHLTLTFGASLGGVVLFELLRFTDLSFDRLFIEGVSFYSGGPVARAGGAVLSRLMVAKHRKAVRDPDAGARKLARLYGEQAARAMATSFAAMSEESIRAIVRDCSRVTLPHLSPDVQRRCTFAYGEKDSDLRLARRTVPRLYPGAELVVWPGWGHCERMSRDSVTYGAMLRRLVEESRKLPLPRGGARHPDPRSHYSFTVEQSDRSTKSSDTRVPETLEATAGHLPGAPPGQDPPLWPQSLPDS